MWTVLYLPEAEEGRRLLPAAEKAAVINADRKLEAIGPQLPYHTRAPSRVRTGFASFGREAVDHLGGSCTAKLVRCSLLQPWHPRRRWTDGDLKQGAEPPNAGDRRSRRNDHDEAFRPEVRS